LIVVISSSKINLSEFGFGVDSVCINIIIKVISDIYFRYELNSTNTIKNLISYCFQCLFLLSA